MSTGKTVDVADLADHRVNVAKIIQEAFFPWPPTNWDAMPDHQRVDFLECADEIFAYLRGWNKGRVPDAD